MRDLIKFSFMEYAVLKVLGLKFGILVCFTGINKTFAR